MREQKTTFGALRVGDIYRQPGRRPNGCWRVENLEPALAPWRINVGAVPVHRDGTVRESGRLSTTSHQRADAVFLVLTSERKGHR